MAIISRFRANGMCFKLRSTMKLSSKLLGLNGFLLLVLPEISGDSKRPQASLKAERKETSRHHDE